MFFPCRFHAFSALTLLTAGVALAAPTTDPAAASILSELAQIDRSAATQPSAGAPDQQEAAHRRMQHKTELVKALAATNSQDPAVLAYLSTRWHNMQMARSPLLEGEVDDVLRGTCSPDVAAEAFVNKFNMVLFKQKEREQAYIAVKPIADAFAERAPNSKYLPGLYVSVASMAPDSATEANLLRKAAAASKTPQEAEFATSRLRTLDLIGKPLVLEFNDATTGKRVRMQDLVGKVVVLDFWATWCAPCVAEMPAMKKIYAEYKDKGVEFIGVSLDLSEDEGGLTKLKNYVQANDISWPQYYQGKMWDADFSSSLGVMSVPTAFLIDQKGNVVNVDALGKLDTLLPKLLATAGATTRPAQ